MSNSFLQVTSFDPLIVQAGTGVRVVSGAVNGSNHLILTMSDGSTIDCGAVGSAGSFDPAGAAASAQAAAQTYADGKVEDSVTAGHHTVAPSGDAVSIALAGKAANLVATAVKTANYTAAPSDFIPVDTTSGNVTITLPTAPADKTRIGAKQVVRGGTNTVAINCGGSDHINTTTGPTSRTLTLLNEAAIFQYNASNSVWYVISDDLSLSQLDARYAAAGSGLVVSGTPLNGGVPTYDVVTGGYIVRRAGTQNAGSLTPMPVGAHVEMLADGSGYASNGTDTGANSRICHQVTAPVNEVRLVYTNWGGSPVEVDGYNDITVKAGIEAANGEIYPVYFNGQRSVTINPGGTVISDPVPVDHAGPSAGFPYLFSRTYVTCASGGKWLTGIYTQFTGESYESGTTTIDKTLSGTIGSNTTARAYGPSAVLGTVPPTTKAAAVAIVGDSIAAGYNDTPTDYGWIVRGLQTNTVGYVKVPSSGQTAAQWQDLANRRRSLTLFAGCQAAICNLGVNDVSAAESLSTIQGYLTTIWTSLAQRGLKVYQSTITPHTSSTDAWATSTNQTVTSAESVRVALNNWIRTTPSPLTGYIEVADLAETARNSGLWKSVGSGASAAYTADGLHPNTNGHAQLAAAITASLCTNIGGPGTTSTIISVKGSGVTTLVNDTFTRTTTAGAGLGSADTGQAWTGSSAFANGTQAQYNSAGITYLDAGAGNFNCTVQADITLPSVGTDVGLVFRLTDTSNYYMMIFDPGAGGTLYLFKSVAGAQTSLGGFAITGGVTYDGAHTYTLAVACNGTSIQGSVNGTTVHTWTDTTYTSQTKYGLYLAGNSTLRYDNFLVTSP